MKMSEVADNVTGDKKRRRRKPVVIPAGMRPISVTVATAHQMTGLGQSTLWKLISDGTLEVVRFGGRGQDGQRGRGSGRVLILFDSLEALIKPAT
jgi:hypothetical protein